MRACISRVAVVAAMAALVLATGCGIKGDPVAPGRETAEENPAENAFGASSDTGEVADDNDVGPGFSQLSGPGQEGETRSATAIERNPKAADQSFILDPLLN